MELAAILKDVELFRGLNTDQIKRLEGIARIETYDEEAVIFNQDSPGDTMYVIADGQVEIRVTLEQGSNHSALFLGQGQIFGEMALLDQGSRSASVISVQDNTIVYAIDSADFLALCQQDTAIGYIMMRNLALDLSFKLRHRNLNPSTAI